MEEGEERDRAGKTESGVERTPCPYEGSFFFLDPGHGLMDAAGYTCLPAEVSGGENNMAPGPRAKEREQTRKRDLAWEAWG